MYAIRSYYESSRLAAEIQESLVAGLAGKYSHIKDLGVRQGPFHVLWNATMPSVLVEVAFISNEREEKRLADRTFQKRSAAAITRGVSNYLEAYSLARITSYNVCYTKLLRLVDARAHVGRELAVEHVAEAVAHQPDRLPDDVAGHQDREGGVDPGRVEQQYRDDAESYNFV